VDKSSLVRAIASYDRARLAFGVLAAVSTVFVIAIQIWLLKLNADLSVIKDREANENKRQFALLTARTEEATRDIEVARREAAEANERAATANERAGEANEAAERERLERIKIEERMRPRVLGRPELVAAAIAPFPEQRLSIECDSDQQPIAMQIIAAVRQHWHNLGMGHSEQVRLVPGIVLFVAPDAAEQTKEAAGALAAGLRAAGIADLEGPVLGAAGMQSAANAPITMRIGARK
jgi:hypothetical protein